MDNPKRDASSVAPVPERTKRCITASGKRAAAAEAGDSDIKRKARILRHQTFMAFYLPIF